MYGDFQCPYCTAAQGILRRVRGRLEGRLRFGFRHFPLEAVHPDARRAAEASEAAAAQGVLLGDARRALRAARAARGWRTSCAPPAAIPGLDAERHAGGARAGAHAARVDRDVASGTELGVPGTPTFFINGARHSGAFDAQALIAALEGREAA